MRYVLECVWSGYTGSQSRCCHREVITEKRARMFDGIYAVRFSDNTNMSVNIRPAKFREKIIPINGYSQLLWEVSNSGITGSVHVDSLGEK